MLDGTGTLIKFRDYKAYQKYLLASLTV
jgi:hypothetical protein